MKWGTLLGAVALVACESPPTETATDAVELRVRTVDHAGAPVGQVHFFVDGKKFGITNADGVFAGTYPAARGATVTFDVQAPAGFQAPIASGRWRQQVGDGAVEFLARLRATEQTYSFMVRGSAGMAVELDDRVIGRTDATGVALITASGVPGARFSLRAGALKTRAVFAEREELYLLTATRSGGLSSTQAVRPASPTSTTRPTRPSPPAARELQAAEAAPAPTAPDAPLDADGPLVDGPSTPTHMAEVQRHVAGGGVLTRRHVDRLRAVPAGHPDYPEANRLLGAFYYRLKDFGRQAEALEKATRRGRYKHDPRVLLEFEFLRQSDRTDEPDVTLLDRAIVTRRRYETLARGADHAGVARAGARIGELSRMRAEFEP